MWTLYELLILLRKMDPLQSRASLWFQVYPLSQIVKVDKIKKIQSQKETLAWITIQIRTVFRWQQALKKEKHVMILVSVHSILNTLPPENTTAACQGHAKHPHENHDEILVLFQVGAKPWLLFHFGPFSRTLISTHIVCCYVMCMTWLSISVSAPLGEQKALVFLQAFLMLWAPQRKPLLSELFYD